MGSNNGTGQPNCFRCAKCRRYNRGGRNDGWSNGVTLTGRKREHKGKVGPRITHIDREYRCDSCDHVGWSAHVDLARKAGESTHLMIDRDTGLVYLPSYVRRAR